MYNKDSEQYLKLLLSFWMKIYYIAKDSIEVTVKDMIALVRGAGVKSVKLLHEFQNMLVKQNKTLHLLINNRCSASCFYYKLIQC